MRQKHANALVMIWDRGPISTSQKLEGGESQAPIEAGITSGLNRHARRRFKRDMRAAEKKTLALAKEQLKKHPLKTD